MAGSLGGPGAGCGALEWVLQSGVVEVLVMGVTRPLTLQKVPGSSKLSEVELGAQGQDLQEVLRDLAWEILSDLPDDIPRGATCGLLAKTSRRS
uniref:PH01B001E05.13 protein n=1 Tax=Phyllostachys edulis TaxID=38705 RepID=L0P2N7_PHYED|nr:PH01B001E05.13 [Phyllostachys edulis]